MLPVVSPVSEQLTAWIISTPGRRLVREPALLLLLLSLCSGIFFYGEYRLTTKGLACAVPAVLLLGLPTSFCGGGRYAHDAPLDSVLFYGWGLGLAGLCVLREETSFVAALQGQDGRQAAYLLLGNVASSAVAMDLGRSLLAPICTWNGRDRLSAMLVLSGCAGLSSVLLLRQRSYTAWLQLGAYVGAAAVLERLRRLQKWPCSPPKSPRPSSPSLAMAEAASRGDDTASSRRASTPTPTSEAFGGTSSPDDHRAHAHASSFLRILPIGAIATAWFAFIFLNFLPGHTPDAYRVAPVLDSAFHPSHPVDVVVSMYQESLESVASLLASLRDIPTLAGARVHVYAKASPMNLTALKQQTGAHRVVPLPNVGREGETYLHHILSHWDLLAKHTLFVQADMHNEEATLRRIRSYFHPQRTGMLSLGFVGHSIGCNGTDQWGWSEKSGIVPYVYGRVYQRPCERILLSYKGQFIVSAERIRGIGQGLYRELHTATVDAGSWAHKEPYLRGRKDSMSAPVFGYTLERLWNVLFQCSDMDVAWKCPSLLSGKRKGGSIRDCQCLDR
ncbi:uncharacterized protein N0V89_006445 [Didymosphaeria variabile]|uniref:Uncharacterized protein n=1 Tax=Didymosphaeria variabile TaxID=1932322 RepID=A0A9W8XPT7_9PLEO|nr:uncharacterized protein N0V89_006445 [Didymosphaeria variabile]KAJ4354708.1 hypothetical protein N0V89_006445 [Didymosphaeria variabile]